MIASGSLEPERKCWYWTRMIDFPSICRFCLIWKETLEGGFYGYSCFTSTILRFDFSSTIISQFVRHSIQAFLRRLYQAKVTMSSDGILTRQ
jgi:hypothetical protein